MKIDKCRTCKHAFTTGRDRWYCQESLADKDDCEEYENKYTPGDCNFCSTIYPEEDTRDILFAKGKYSGVYIDEFITIDNEGNYCINIDPGDPYETGYLEDIKFCPYCGRKLAENEDRKAEKLRKLKSQLSKAGDRRDWDECERIEKEIEELEGE